MNSVFRPSRFNLLPEVVKNLLIINGLMFFASIVLGNVWGIDLNDFFGLYYIKSDFFRPYQLVTHLFMHGNFWHLFSNMLALWMFGNVLENYWGPKKFLTYYMITGLGAALIHSAVVYYQIQDMEASMLFAPDMLNYAKNIPTVGASGAVFGVLLAFGMLFPNTLIYLYFAIPVKAKYFVMFYGAYELFTGLQNNPGDNVAHFAHLGGMLFGFFLIKYWKKDQRHMM